MKKFTIVEIMQAEFECSQDMIQFYEENFPPQSVDDVAELSHALESFHKAIKILTDKLTDKEVDDLFKED